MDVSPLLFPVVDVTKQRWKHKHDDRKNTESEPTDKAVSEVCPGIADWWGEDLCQK